MIAIEGVVRSPRGAPIADAEVAFWAVGSAAGERRLEPLPQVASTDSEGNFTVEVDDPREQEPDGGVVIFAGARSGTASAPRPSAFVTFAPDDRPPQLGRVGLIADQLPADLREPVLTMGELTANVAAVVGAMQAELHRYPTAGGAFVVDALEVVLPVRASVDALGQLRAEVIDTDDPAAPRMRLAVRPTPSAAPSEPPPTVPIEELDDVLTGEQIATLHQLRIFDLLDLDRVLAQPATRVALQPLDLPLDAVRQRAEVVAGLGLPGPLGVALLRSGVTSRDTFLARPIEELAQALGDELGEQVPFDVLDAWREQSIAQRRVPAPLVAPPPTDGGAMELTGPARLPLIPPTFHE
jgi:hypothetical protein